MAPLWVTMFAGVAVLTARAVHWIGYDPGASPVLADSPSATTQTLCALRSCHQQLDSPGHAERLHRLHTNVLASDCL